MNDFVFGFRSIQMNYDVKNGIEALFKVQNAVQTKIQTIQMAVSEQKSGVVAVFDGTLTIEQANELQMYVNNYGYYTAIADLGLNDDTLIVAQSIHDRFWKNDGFYTDEYLCELFGYPDSEVTVDMDERKIIFDSNDVTREVSFDELLEKLVEDYQEKKDTFIDAFSNHYSQTRQAIKMVGTQIASNEIDVDMLVLVKSDVTISQVNQSLVQLSNQLDGIYREINPSKVVEKNEIDVLKIVYVVAIVIGICVLSSLLLLLFTKPTIDAGAAAVSSK